MKLQSAERAKEEFQDLARLHVSYFKAQIKVYKARLLWGIPLLGFGLLLSVFGVVRFFDGLAERMLNEHGGDAQFLSGSLLLLAAGLLLILAAVALKQAIKVAAQLFHEIREDIQWMKKLL